jgi:hypothetical protein
MNNIIGSSSRNYELERPVPKFRAVSMNYVGRSVYMIILSFLVFTFFHSQQSVARMKNAIQTPQYTSNKRIIELPNENKSVDGID